jgi:hypothetical protein
MRGIDYLFFEDNAGDGKQDTGISENWGKLKVQCFFSTNEVYLLILILFMLEFSYFVFKLNSAKAILSPIRNYID